MVLAQDEKSVPNQIGQTCFEIHFINPPMAHPSLEGEKDGLDDFFVSAVVG